MDKIDTIGTTWAEPQLQERLAITNVSATPRNSKTAVKAPTVRRTSIPTSVMVHTAIKSQMITSRSSVSFSAIKKYIRENYLAASIDLNNRVKYIKRYIISALEKGKLVRVKGKGVSGSFRLPTREFNNIKKAEKRNKRKPKAKRNVVKKTQKPKAVTKQQRSKLVLFD